MGGAICLSSVVVPTILTFSIFKKPYNWNKGVDLTHLSMGMDLSNKYLCFDQSVSLPYVDNFNKNTYFNCYIALTDNTAIRIIVQNRDQWELYDTTKHSWPGNTPETNASPAYITNQKVIMTIIHHAINDKFANSPVYNVWYINKDNPAVGQWWSRSMANGEGDQNKFYFQFPPNIKITNFGVAYDKFDGAGEQFYNFLIHQKIYNSLTI